MTRETINGFEIVRQRATPAASGTRSGRVILVDRGTDYENRERWVTAWHGRKGNEWDAEWLWGHYFNDKNQADEDFTARAARGY